MTIQRFTDTMIIADGGTVATRAVLDDGTILECGVDARIPKTRADRVLFVGGGYPTAPSARVLLRGSSEEQEFITALREFVSRHPSDETANMLLRGVLNHDHAA